MKKKKVLVSIIFTMFISLNFSACSTIENFQKKLGIKNEYFEYLNTKDIDKISIQSNRDKGFKFIVTEKNAIENMYNILSKAKASDTKSKLEPDYIFEFYLGDEVKKYNYVVGADEGNFYDDKDSFTVSKRLDEVLMQNLSVIRKPRDFEYVYYNSILNVLKLKKDELNSEDYKVGIDIEGDMDCLKYMFSTDLEKFIQDANKIVKNVSLVKNNLDEFDFVINVKSRGFNTSVYKSNIIINNKRNHTEQKYYILANNQFDEWNIDIYEATDTPKDVLSNW